MHHLGRDRIRPALAAFTAALALTLGGAGCRAVVDAHGTDNRSARANVDSLAFALEQRFTNVERAPRFSHARMRIARYVFAPSKLVNDTTIWTHSASARTGAVRTLEVSAAFSESGYHFEATPAAAIPRRTGSQRHLMRLTELGNNDWQWATRVDHAVGSVAPEEIGDALVALFASLEPAEQVVRRDYRLTSPRSGTALGRLISVDSLLSEKQTDGSSLVRVVLRVRSDDLGAGYPALSKYIDKYVLPASFNLELTDDMGASWFKASMRSGLLTASFRSRDGVLQPLRGARRPMPRTMTVEIDARAKLGVFSVGASGLTGRFTQLSTPDSRMWEFTFAKEPHWDLPLNTERLLRSPLRRPFEGEGVTFRIGFRRGAAGQTLLSRDLDVTVRESAIMRFLGNLGFGAMSDFAGKVELEENAFLAETFRALRSDVRSQ